MYDRVVDWYKVAETKAQLLLTVNGAFVTVAFGLLSGSAAELRRSPAVARPLGPGNGAWSTEVRGRHRNRAWPPSGARLSNRQSVHAVDEVVGIWWKHLWGSLWAFNSFQMSCPVTGPTTPSSAM
jgi:hypothetical protein